MSMRKVPFMPDEYYHVYNRGNSKQIIFKDRFDYERFQALLYVANGTAPFVWREIREKYVFDFVQENRLVHIGAYCAMPNHFHILLKPAVEHGVEQFMQKLSTSYASFFNHKYERVGSLYEGKFKAEWVDSDEYLKYLFSYIHLNPVKLIQSDWKEQGIRDSGAAMEYLKNYKYSSFLDFDMQDRIESKVLNRNVYPGYFKTTDTFKAEILEWINFNPKAIDLP